MIYKKEWTHGDKRKLAALAGIQPQHLNAIHKNRTPCAPDLATRLELAAKKLGYNIPRYTWAFPEERFGNPLFPHAMARGGKIR
jgi:transcriptional regulator with XRE-family HTH domain